MLKAFYQLLGEENKGHRTKCMIVKKKQLIVTTGTITWATSKSIVSVLRKKKMITFISVLLFLVDLNNQENIL
jgi:hypothetical protein